MGMNSRDLMFRDRIKTLQTAKKEIKMLGVTSMLRICKVSAYTRCTIANTERRTRKRP